MGDADERAGRVLARVQGMLGPDPVLTAVLGGGRGPADQVRLVPWGDERTPDRPADPPWPGRLPAPSPATVLPEPLPAEVLDAAGAPVGVTGRFAVTAPPARLAVPGRAPADVVVAGPGRGRPTSAGGTRRRRAGAPASSWSPRTAAPGWSPSTAAGGGWRPCTTDRRSSPSARHQDRRAAPRRPVGLDSSGNSANVSQYPQVDLRTMFDDDPVVGRGASWAGTTRRSRGRSWSASCPGAGRTARSPATAATARPGPAAAATTSPPGRPPADRPTGAVRGAALPLQLQLPRRRQPPGGAGRGGGPARADRRSRSPTTTGSTGWSGSPRPPGRSGCRRSSAPSCPSGLTEPQNGDADPEGRHLLVLARGPEGYGRLCRRSAPAQLAGGEKGRPVYDLGRAGRRARRPLAGAHRLPQGHRPGGAARPTGVDAAARRAGPAGRPVRPRTTSRSS